MSVYIPDPGEKLPVKLHVSDGINWVPMTQPGAAAGGLTDTQLRATPVPVEATIDTTGLATDTGQATGNASLSTISAKDFATQSTLAALLTELQTKANFDETQPVSLVSVPTHAVTGPVTDTQLRASAVPISLATAPTTPVTGTFFQATQPVSLATAPTTPVTGTFWQATQPVSFAPAAVTFKGRACAFRTPGRAGTSGQKILSLHNATGSPVTATVSKVIVDIAQTVIKAVTVAPPIVRLWKVTVLPTNGTALTKTQTGGSGASSSSITILGDASADGTGSGTTLTATLPAGTFVTQEFAARLITAAGLEPFTRAVFLGDGETITLKALEGLVVFLDYTAATQNPTTDMWLAGIEWSEV